MQTDRDSNLNQMTDTKIQMFFVRVEHMLEMVFVPFLFVCFVIMDFILKSDVLKNSESEHTVYSRKELRDRKSLKKRRRQLILKSFTPIRDDRGSIKPKAAAQLDYFSSKSGVK